MIYVGRALGGGIGAALNLIVGGLIGKFRCQRFYNVNVCLLLIQRQCPRKSTALDFDRRRYRGPANYIKFNSAEFFTGRDP